MDKRKRISAILQEVGRITESDVERTLDYQRTHGGLFGEALVALGIASQAEVDWALASQFGLPYIFPDPDAADVAAAALVPPDWALTHLAVPILRAGDRLTVVVANPLQQDVIEALQKATGFEVELALAAPARIRALIRTLYGLSGDRSHALPRSLSVTEFLAQALVAGADRLGISVRGPHAWGWYRTDQGGAGRPDDIDRFPLLAGWQTQLASAVQPLAPHTDNAELRSRIRWRAVLLAGKRPLPVDAEVLIGAGGMEYLFWPENAPASAAQAQLDSMVLPPALIAELRLLARSGRVRIALAGDLAASIRAMLPLLPLLAVDEPLRAVHLTDQETGGVPGACTVRPGPNEDLSGALDSYRFDAVTVDLPADGFPLDRVLAAAPLAFAYLRESDWRDRLSVLGIDQVLTLFFDHECAISDWLFQPARA